MRRIRRNFKLRRIFLKNSKRNLKLLDIFAAFRYTDSKERGGAMRKVIPFEPQQTAYFLRWLREMSQKGWELKDIKGFDAVFAPADFEGQCYALFPPDATAQELDELFRRIEEGSITTPSKPERPMPSSLALPEDPRFAELVGKIGPYQYVQLIVQLRRDNGWEAISDWGGFTVMRSTRPDAVPPPRIPEYTEKAERNRKGLCSTTASNLGFLLSVPVLALLKGTGLLFWQKLLAGGAAVVAACFIMELVLRHIFSSEKWKDMSYEDCLHEAGRGTVLLYVVAIGAAFATILYSILSLLLRQM